MVLWSPTHVPVHSWYRTRVEVAGFDVFELLHTDGVEKEKGVLANTVTLMDKLHVSLLHVSVGLEL